MKKTAVGWRLENVENPCTKHCSFQSLHFVVEGASCVAVYFWFELCWNHYRANVQAEHDVGSLQEDRHFRADHGMTTVLFSLGSQHSELCKRQLTSALDHDKTF